jgi:hypothetical protein
MAIRSSHAEKENSIEATSPSWMDHELGSDLVLPTQFFAGARLDASQSPEKRFMLAVLEQAVRDFCREVTAVCPRRRRDFEEVEAWFASDETEWPCSFATVCEIFDLDAGWVRSRLWNVRDRRRACPDDPTSRLRPFRRRTGAPRRPSPNETRIFQAA